MPESFWEQQDLEALAQRVGTPFYVYSADVLQRRVTELKELTAQPGLQARYGMKACSNRHILQFMQARDIWIDAVSGNEVLRARAAGFAMGANPPAVMLTADVFRDNALQVVREHQVLPNIGSPAMIEELHAAGYRGPIGLRLNPGFGHGHVHACDTGGPSSKHGIWHEDAEQARAAAERAGFPVVLLHVHVGSGPEIEEFDHNMERLIDFFAARIANYPDIEAVNLGGGIPHPYRPGVADVDLQPLARILQRAHATLSERSGRHVRIEIEPGRYFVAPCGALVTRVTDVKATRTNEKGEGNRFVMVDAGFCDLVRPAMYGSYHHITVHGVDATATSEPLVVAGPLCESGDVFTRDASELLDPRLLPTPRRGDLVVIHDAGAYAAAMSSLYNSVGRVPEVWLEGGKTHLIARRETVADIVRRECFEPLD
jgi:diaminopimelate decarboxylase